MNLVSVAREYVRRVVADIPGLKALLLDEDTMGILSLVHTQSELFEYDIFLNGKFDPKNRANMTHMRAVCFLRPINTNFQLLEEELSNPNYGEYHIYFTGPLELKHIERIAQADAFEAVQSLQEVYLDYFTLSPSTFHLNCPRWDQGRPVSGISALCLSLKRCPVIRFQKNSSGARTIAERLSTAIEKESALFDFRKTSSPTVVLILDRLYDPVTPLLLQWTYEAMIHELIGLQNNRVTLDEKAEKKKDLQNITLSPTHDTFYAANRFSNFGDLGQNLKAMVDEFQEQHHTTRGVETIAEMQKFVESYPEFRRKGRDVSKHVALVSELSHIVESRSLLNVSEAEQELAATDDHAAGLKHLRHILNNSSSRIEDKFRVSLLYRLRYAEETSVHIVREIRESLQDGGLSPERLKLFDMIARIVPREFRDAELFEKGFLSAAKSTITRGLQGVENVYTQHQPYLVKLLQMIFRGRLREELYPFLHKDQYAVSMKPKEVVVFVLGGITCAELRIVQEMNDKYPELRIILGGTSMIRSEDYVKDLEDLVYRKHKETDTDV